MIFFVAAMAETKRVPFDIPEGEAEIIGYFIEYSGLKFAMFFLGEFIEVALAGVLMALVYFGGWQLPWVAPESYHSVAPYVLIAAGVTVIAAGLIAVRGHGAKTIGAVLVSAGVLPAALGLLTLVVQTPPWAVSIVTVAAQLTVFCAKAAFLIWLQFMVRWTLPRFRFDQLLSIGWKKLVPWSLVNIVLTGAVIIWMGA
jgi:NADH-quinone oxidoreductase subunit H